MRAAARDLHAIQLTGDAGLASCALGTRRVSLLHKECFSLKGRKQQMANVSHSISICCCVGKSLGPQSIRRSFSRQDVCNYCAWCLFALGTRKECLLAAQRARMLVLVSQLLRRWQSACVYSHEEPKRKVTLGIFTLTRAELFI